MLPHVQDGWKRPLRVIALSALYFACLVFLSVAAVVDRGFKIYLW